MRTLIIDVGAGLKNQYAHLLGANPNLIIYAIQPHPELAEELRQTHRSRLLKQLFVHEIALTNIDGPVKLHLINESGASSVLPMNPSSVRKWRYPVNRKAFESKGEITVIGKTMETFLEHARITGNITLINIAVQGYAYQVLAGIKKRQTWEKIKEINVKVHTFANNVELYHGQSKKEQIVDILMVHMYELKGTKMLSQNQEENLHFRNTVAASSRWPFDKHGWAMRLL